MTGQRRTGVAIAVLVVLALIGGYLNNRGATPDGQIVFVLRSATSVVGADPTLGTVAITECRMSERGLVVSGHVDPDGPVTAVVVVPGGDAGAGRAVGTGQEANVHGGGTIVGDFTIALPWATPSASFARAVPGSFSSELVPVGPRSYCPQVG